MLSFLLELIFPRHCIGCTTTRTYLCDSCSATFEPARTQPQSWIYPLFSYKDKLVRHAIHLLKYKGVRSIAKVFAEKLYDKILEDLGQDIYLSHFTKPYIVAIPLSTKKHRMRGFNQINLITQELYTLHEGLFEYDTKALFKIRETENQASIKHKQQRATNLVGCFRADRKKVSGRNIILIDDVTTTGATLHEARTALLTAGARKVIAYTIAH